MNVHLNLSTRDAAIYRQWALWMLGAGAPPSGFSSAISAADELCRQESQAIRRAAGAFWRLIGPLAWGQGVFERVLYRGLRLGADLDECLLPEHPAYASLPALSYSESPDIACYFADPGALGLPELPIPNTVTGGLGLPPHGYIAVCTVHARHVLLHWQFVLRAPGFFGTNGELLATVQEQREVTVSNHPDLTQRLHAFHKFGASYIAARYPGGEWQPATAARRLGHELVVLHPSLTRMEGDV